MSFAAVEAFIARIDAAPAPPAATSGTDAGAYARLVDRVNAAATPPLAGADTGTAGIAARAAAANGVDPALVLAVIANESSFNAGATSPAGAKGLMQLMPATARSLGVGDPDDPAQNVAGGTAYLRALLDRFGGSIPLAVAAYNAGPGAVESCGGIPPFAETQRYVGAVLATYARLHSR